MLIDCGDIFKIPGEKRVIDTALDLSELDLFGETPFREPCKVSGAIENRAGIVRLTLDIDAVADTSCARCLCPVREERHYELDELLVRELEDDELDGVGYLLLPNGVLDLTTEVTDAILLDSDMITLCRPDCKGLCPVCGADLNSVDCGHNKIVPGKNSGLADALKKAVDSRE